MFTGLYTNLQCVLGMVAKTSQNKRLKPKEIEKNNCIPCGQ
jgi:hypothetical protein